MVSRPEHGRPSPKRGEGNGHYQRDRCRRAPTPTLEQRQADWPEATLQPKHVWAIRTRLQLAGRTRDLALFNLAIDSKLRGCDVVSLKVQDVAPHGYAIDRATVRQNKTGVPVRFEITEQTRQAIDEHLATRKHPGDFLFQGRRGKGRCLTTRQYARLLSEWIARIGLAPSLFGTHSLRRTRRL
jgi:integrase